jgi:hypothetical protein
MRLLRFLWRLGEAAGTLVWLVSIFGGICLLFAAALYGAFEGLPKLLQALAALLFFALATVVILEVIQYGRQASGRFHRPKLRLALIMGPEFLHTSYRTGHSFDSLDELIQWQYPDDQVITCHTFQVKVAEVGNAPAKNVAVRICGIDPPPQPGHFSLPIRLAITSGDDAGSASRTNLEPLDREYVALFHIGETAAGRRFLTPPFFLAHDEFVLEIEALIEGRRSDVRYFKVVGLSHEQPDGARAISDEAPRIEEVDSLQG